LGNDTKDVIELASKIFLSLSQLSTIIPQFNYLCHQLLL
jgi:hypothetical protein